MKRVLVTSAIAALLCLGAGNLEQAIAQTSTSPYGPLKLWGKSSAACDSYLGKPGFVKKHRQSVPPQPDGTDVIETETRVYKVNKNGLVRISLGFSKNQVNSIDYDFDKRKIPTWEKGIQLLGIAPKSVQVRAIERGTGLRLPGKFFGEWTDQNPDLGEKGKAFYHLHITEVF